MDWKVFREKIEVMPHPNAEKLEICSIGGNPIVCQKDLHHTGEICIFIPKDAILPENLQSGFKEYLKGPNKDRVGQVRLRGEPSTGIVIHDREEFKDVPLGEDISEKLGIIKYEVPLPVQLSGRVQVLKSRGDFSYPVTYHDVENFTINKKYFVFGEQIIVTSKIHGSQLAAKKYKDGKRFVSSKGLIKRQLVIEDDGKNNYWNACHNTKLFDLLDKYYPNMDIEAFAECIPTQRGYSYGKIEPTLLLFDIRIDGNHVKFNDIPEEIKQLWVPVVYRGCYDPSIFQRLANSKERVSGRGLHQEEGVVIRPDPDRMVDERNPFRLMVKVLNDKYKEDDDAIN